VADEALRVGRLQVENGTIAPVEGTRLEAAMVQAQQAALDATNTAEQAANTLLLALGSDPHEEVVPATPAGDVPDDTTDAEAAIEVAMAQNVDLAVARSNLELSRFNLDNSKHALLPSLSATGAVGVAAQDTSTGTAISGLVDADNQPFASVAGKFTVPIGNRTARGSRDTNAAVVGQRERELADLERSVRAQTEQQVRTMQSARRRTELADANARLAEQTLSAEEALASAGRNIQRDVLEARNQLDRAKADAAKARTDYRLAQAQLLRLQGQLDRMAAP
jgi:outer membrane protein TolC